MKKILLFSLIVVIVLISGCVQTESSDSIKKFSSYQDLESYVKSNQNSYGFYGGMDRGMVTTAGASESAPQASTDKASDYSTTNIQVAGVDEPDIVKNDGKYIYVVSGKNVFVVDAYPAENANLLYNISVNGTISNIFINENKLTLFGLNDYSYDIYGSYQESSFVKVYDISEDVPVLTRDVSVDGGYYDARMIGDYVYAVFNKYFYYSDDIPIPVPVVQTNGASEKVAASDIYYFDGSGSNQFTTIISVNTQNDEEIIDKKVYLMNYGQNMYVSEQNIYITYQKQIDYNYYLTKTIKDVYILSVPLEISKQMQTVLESDKNIYEISNIVQEIYYNYSNTLDKEARSILDEMISQRMQIIQQEMENEQQKTVIQKIAIADGSISYKHQGYVLGYILNQFSMDESDGYFRIATTQNNWRTGKSTNNVYILDSDLNQVSKLEDIAPGEMIYSARFIGNRCYLVTFKRVDPFFVIDLTPSNPQILGYLKIPGYSDYLHPYDENHIIGIGKEATDQGTFAWYQGVKLSLFDVTDVTNPIQISNYSIGDRGTDSPALHDHKAFLFDKEKNLLVLPIALAQVNQSMYEEQYGTIPDWAYGDFIWQGAYVFDLTVENGFVFKGKVSHNETLNQYDYYWSPYAVKRTLFMDDVLYTISDKMIKMNKLVDMTYLNSVELPYEYSYWYPWYGVRDIAIAAETTVSTMAK
ncbi:MAG: beta-propeller domain-containing protein [Candidatus Aenigmarchaeota archaeon]|nr:beta-propeller domain-containing protein [Candidatus Aenigmarchaeota archaeon]